MRLPGQFVGGSAFQHTPRGRDLFTEFHEDGFNCRHHNVSSPFECVLNRPFYLRLSARRRMPSMMCPHPLLIFFRICSGCDCCTHFFSLSGSDIRSRCVSEVLVSARCFTRNSWCCQNRSKVSAHSCRGRIASALVR